MKNYLLMKNFDIVSLTNLINFPIKILSQYTQKHTNNLKVILFFSTFSFVVFPKHIYM